MDATIFENLRHSTSVIVVHDEGGNFLGASTLVVEENTDAEVVKALGHPQWCSNR